MKCLYCGSSAGYEMLEKVHRYLRFSFDYEPIGSSEDVSDYCGTRKYCINCNRILPKRMFENKGE